MRLNADLGKKPFLENLGFEISIKKRQGRSKFIISFYFSPTNLKFSASESEIGFLMRLEAVLYRNRKMKWINAMAKPSNV